MTRRSPRPWGLTRAWPRRLTGVMESRELETAVRERWDFTDPAATMEVMAEASRAEDVSVAAGLVWLTQATRAAGMQGDIDAGLETLAILDRAVEHVPEGSERHHVLARIAIERGRLYSSSDRPADALPHFITAYDEAVAAELEGLAIDALHMTAIVKGQLNGPAESRAWNERALTMAETSEDPEALRWRASLLNNLAWDHHDAGDLEQALALFERAVDIRRAENDAVALQVAEWSVARALRSLGRYDEALSIQQRLAATPPGADDGYVHEELGENLLALGRGAEARPALARAYQMLSRDPWLVEHEAARLGRLEALAAEG